MVKKGPKVDTEKEKKKKRVGAGVVDWARLENEKSEMTRRFESYPTRRKGMVAEWLNAADCNFVPIRCVGSNPSHPKKNRRNGKSRSKTSQEKKGEEKRKDSRKTSPTI